MGDVIQLKRVALVGFGEAGGIIGADLVKQGCEVSTYDILLDVAGTRDSMIAKAERAGVRAIGSLRELVSATARAVDRSTTRAADGGSPQLIISAVTATSSQTVAKDAAPFLSAGQIFLDINSCAPATKRGNAAAVEASGASYVEAAVMAPVPPQRLAVPMLLGGRQAAEVCKALRALGMNASAISEEIGIASAVKMCRSIVIKGLEAVTTECVLAARQLGAEEQVFASLQNTFPHMGWTAALPDYLVSRVAEHGLRRAAEMREVARTLEDIGMQPIMASAIAERQDALVAAMAAKHIDYPHGQPFSWRALADELAGKQ